jgi:hypothetical protein
LKGERELPILKTGQHARRGDELAGCRSPKRLNNEHFGEPLQHEGPARIVSACLLTDHVQ